MNEHDARIEYADVIDLPHHQSATRHHMSLYDRAAQFAPFAALTGYDDMVAEEARLTDSVRELSEQDMAELNRAIALLENELREGRHPYVSVTHFVPDALKSGGRYENREGYLKKIDLVNRVIILYGSDDIENKQADPVTILIDRIIAFNETLLRTDMKTR